MRRNGGAVCWGLVGTSWEGALFLAYYDAYAVYLIFAVTGSQQFRVFSAAMLLFVIPAHGGDARRRNGAWPVSGPSGQSEVHAVMEPALPDAEGGT